MAYIRAIGFKIAISFLLIYIMGSMMGIGSNLWLARWSDEAKKIQARADLNQSDETHIRLGVYTALGLGQGKRMSLRRDGVFSHLCGSRSNSHGIGDGLCEFDST